MTAGAERKIFVILKEKEVKEIHSALTMEDINARLYLANIWGGVDAERLNIAEAAAVGAIIDRLEAYERNADFDNWGFDEEYLDDSAEEHLDKFRAALWAAFRCGYVQALKDRD